LTYAVDSCITCKGIIMMITNLLDAELEHLTGELAGNSEES
jgi:hypothetical protein